jgi:hypothetical protein
MIYINQLFHTVILSIDIKVLVILKQIDLEFSCRNILIPTVKGSHFTKWLHQKINPFLKTMPFQWKIVLSPKMD